MKTKNLLIFAICLLNLTPILAQQTKITCKVLNQKNEPIEYANVQLLNKDSAFIKGTVSDKNGDIILSAYFPDKFWLVISAVGYETFNYYSEGENANLELGYVKLKEANVSLDNVTFTANNIIHQADRQVIIPNNLQQKSANNALELLRNMSLPLLNVNAQEKKIERLGNGSVLLRINGVNASIDEIIAIPAKDIIKVEYYNNPGVRIKEDVMVDFIVKRRNTGGYISTDLTNAPHVGYGNDMFTTKFNYKNSAWSAVYSLSYRNYKERITDVSTTFNFPNGDVVDRREMGINSPFNYKDHNISLIYNYALTDKRVINVAFTNRIFKYSDFNKSINTYSDKPDKSFFNYLNSRNRENNPILDFYYQENLSKSQSLFFNLVGGYIGSGYFYNSKENDQSDNPVYVYTSDVKGDKYSIIGEGNHQIKWDKTILYTGINYKFGHAKNKYAGSVSENSTLRNSDLYVYSQLQGKINDLSYTAGIGVSYSQFNDKNISSHFWTFRPSVSLSYLPLKGLFIQYTFNSRPVTPGLASLSDVSQVVNEYEMNRGNPNLKPYRTYFNQLSVNYQKGAFKYDLGVSHEFHKNVFMNDIFFDESVLKFVNTSNNQKYYQSVNTFGTITWEIVRNMLSLYVGGQITWMESNGNNYNHKLTSYFYRGQLNFNHKNWNAYIGGYSRYKSLWGETINHGDFWYTIEVGYKHKELYLGLACNNFFTPKWSAGSETLYKAKSKIMWTYIDDSSPIFCLRLSWNFNWGKQSKSGEKMLNNKDTDSGILKAQ